MVRQLLFSAGLLGLAVLAGCVAPSPDAAMRPRPVSGTASLAAPAAAWPKAEWWRAYKDPQLDALIAEALAGSPDVAAAEARLHRAEALARQADAARQPSLSANASTGFNKQSYNNGIPPEFVPRGYNSVGRATLDFNWEIDFWGKNRAASAAAGADARAAVADRAAAEVMLSTSVASTYAQLAQQFAQRAVAVDAIRLREATLGQVEQRVIGGLDTRAELKAAEAGVPAARGDVAAIDESIAITRHALAALLGAGPDRGAAITPPPRVQLAAFGLPATLAADIVGRKPEIVAARWRAEAAAQRIHVARAQFYPNVNLAAFFGFQSLGLANLVDAGSDIGQVGPAFSLPIFDGGRLKANLRGQEADYALAVADYDGAVARALQDIADAAASTRALTGRLAEARASLAAEEEAYKVAQIRFTGGLANYQSVLIVEDNVLQRRRQLADLEARAFTLDVALVRALGGGFTTADTVLAAK
ncbi:efflux transporter outer membrane subunit [Polymorphobacter fuscus]|uniref:Efflux transporter outer membrane subunit n=1 Tax=Sandarakinorhabdus fusca TaxID=1439888 RepID=A0A7C9GPH6_9SPHN|nr:efflux transporter outer membrane subunit [Polymorphobacter fuscus]KAB7646332.1 efflux transporter outer membrane subunit [Polymorphobacter fuscus]MQT17557.1 efflux transporter outer membrane subunit [Polymorphobacter fuscus]NJC09901.1 NodT family efflux transporter outer membrane factor (OMF) lipoprotein [Polymorphobacter fuscus]